MVEMLESASILNNISDRSIVLLDEIGRGTSTYDGISIAWAMVEYLHNHPTAHARTLFATHYHELNEMEKMYPRVKNYHVTVKEMNNTIVFLRKLERGGTEHSFGIHVAKMAGMPASVVSRADEILKNLVKVYGTDEIVPSKSPKLRGRKQASVKDAVVDVPARRSGAGADPRSDQGTGHRFPYAARSAQQAERDQEDRRYLTVVQDRRLPRKAASCLVSVAGQRIVRVMPPVIQKFGRRSPPKSQ